MAFGLSGSQSSTSSKSDAQSTDQSASQSLGISSQDIAFRDMYAQLFGGATAAANAVDLPTYKGEAAMLFSGGTKFLDSLQGGAASDYLTSRLEGNGVLDQQIATLKESLMSGFDESLAGIRSGAIMGGTFGGGRQGVAEGVAARGLNQTLGQGVTSLLTANQAAKDNAAVNLGQLQTTQASVGLGALTDLSGLAQAGSMADLLPFSVLSQILGGPTTLTQSLQASQASSYGQSTAKSTSKGSSGSFGFSL